MGRDQVWRGVLVAICTYLFVVGALAAKAAVVSNTGPNGRLTREQLVADVRELSELLESTHPDPYINGGGKVAYHRRLQTLIRSMPDEGMSRTEFRAALLPFVAALGDGHTTVEWESSNRDRNNPGGLPLYLEVVENRLYIEAVTHQRLLPLIGATLESIEGVAFADLVAREFRRQGHDNEHHALSALSRRGALFYRDPLRRLIPEWTRDEEIRVELRLPSGEIRPYTLAAAADVEYPLSRRKSRIDVPDRTRAFGYHFLGDDRSVAYLWIDNMTTYREMYEYSRAVGSSGWKDWAGHVYERLHGTPAPEDPAVLIAGLPSATETFHALVRHMKLEGTGTLIVDLRKNFGGNDLMVQILLYFLVGFDHSVSLAEQTATVQKMSPLLDQSTEVGTDFEQIHYADQVPLQLGDYDFSLDSSFMPGDELHVVVRQSFVRMFRQVPTFSEVFEARLDEAHHLPKRIVVLSGNGTQSSGFDLLTHLYRLGAEIVGVAPSQAGNSFGNIRHFELSHSKVKGWVSTKYFVGYPQEAPTGFALEPDHPLSYQQLATYDFDWNASLLLALEEIAASAGGSS